jgi:hypothetical protein
MAGPTVDGMAKKISLEERLQRHPTAREVGGALSKGIDRLPVNELTRTMLKYKATEVVVTLAETGAALGAAARDGAETFQQQRDEEAGREPRGPQGPADPRRGAGTRGPAGDDISVRLERLAKLHADGHLTDREYLAAKSKVLGFD